MWKRPSVEPAGEPGGSCFAGLRVSVNAVRLGLIFGAGGGGFGGSGMFGVLMHMGLGLFCGTNSCCHK